MLRKRVRTMEIATLVLCVLVLLSIFIPWVKTGVLEERDTVNGVDIPVLGWSSIVLTLVAIALAVGGLVLRNRWMWCAQLFVVGCMLTGATGVLMTLDVMDSAVVGWITKVLPEQIRNASPELQATFSLWFSYGLTLLAATTGCLVVIARSSWGDTELDDWSDLDGWSRSTSYGEDAGLPEYRWTSHDERSTDRPSWM